MAPEADHALPGLAVAAQVLKGEEPVARLQRGVPGGQVAAVASGQRFGILPPALSE